MKYYDNMYVFDNDMNAIADGIRGYGVVSGCVVTAQEVPDMTVAVAAGAVVASGILVSVSGTNKTVVHDDTNPRKYIISVNNTGVVTATAGTPAVAAPVGSVGPYTRTPIPPDVPSDDVILAEVWVEANATEINSDDITDRRITITLPDDTPVSSELVDSISSNWAHKHITPGEVADPHTQYLKESEVLMTLDGKLIF